MYEYVYEYEERDSRLVLSVLVHVLVHSNLFIPPQPHLINVSLATCLASTQGIRPGFYELRGNNSKPAQINAAADLHAISMKYNTHPGGATTTRTLEELCCRKLPRTMG